MREMLKFNEFLLEQKEGSGLTIFDIDDTLFRTNSRIAGATLHPLNNSAIRMMVVLDLMIEFLFYGGGECRVRVRTDPMGSRGLPTPWGREQLKIISLAYGAPKGRTRT